MFKEKTVLYYPTIRIPRGTWLNQAVLYWGQIASIVPEAWTKIVQRDQHIFCTQFPTTNVVQEGSWKRDRDLHGMFISLEDCKKLEDLKILRTISPEKLVIYSGNKRHEFEKEFIDIISNSKNLPKCGEKRKINDETWIQQDKLSEELANLLKEKKLVSKELKEENGLHYYIFSAEVADIYMSLLARYLADLDSKYTIPFTNFDNCWNYNYKIQPDRSKFLCNNVIFNLPVPDEKTELDKIIKFRKDNLQDLKKFQRNMHELEVSVQSDSDFDTITSKGEKYIELIKESVNDFDQRMHEEKIQSTIAAVRSIASTKNIKNGSIAGGIMGGIASELIGKPHDPAILASFSLGGVLINSGISLYQDWINLKCKQSAEMRDFAFSYFSQAKKSGIIRQI